MEKKSALGVLKYRSTAGKIHNIKQSYAPPLVEHRFLDHSASPTIEWLGNGKIEKAGWSINLLISMLFRDPIFFLRLILASDVYPFEILK